MCRRSHSVGILILACSVVLFLFHITIADWKHRFSVFEFQLQRIASWRSCGHSIWSSLSCWSRYCFHYDTRTNNRTWVHEQFFIIFNCIRVEEHCKSWCFSRKVVWVLQVWIWTLFTQQERNLYTNKPLLVDAYIWFQGCGSSVLITYEIYFGKVPTHFITLILCFICRLWLTSLIHIRVSLM